MSVARDVLAALMAGHEYDRLEVDQLGDDGHQLQLRWRDGQVLVTVTDIQFTGIAAPRVERLELSPDAFEEWFAALASHDQSALERFARRPPRRP